MNTIGPPSLPAGTPVGSYRIDDLIAHGGMASVYRASHQVLPRRAAIKIPLPHIIESARARDRMLREARLLASIDHPRIVQLYDAGLFDDGRPWVAMELLDGQTLGDHLFVRGVLPAAEVARIIVDVAGALRVAHGSGVIHRDIKPDNIMLVPSATGPEVKVIDWGLAHIDDALRMTRDDLLPGTPCYMAPEALRGYPITAACDVYALGVVAYELLAGHPPFDGRTPLDIALKTVNLPVPALERSDAPAELLALVMAMLAKDPRRRPSLSQIRQELDDNTPEIEVEIELDDLDEQPSRGEIWRAGKATAYGSTASGEIVAQAR